MQELAKVTVDQSYQRNVTNLKACKNLQKRVNCKMQLLAEAKAEEAEALAKVCLKIVNVYAEEQLLAYTDSGSSINFGICYDFALLLCI